MDLITRIRQWFWAARPTTAVGTQPQDARRSVLLVGHNGLPSELYKLLFREQESEFICRYAKNAERGIEFIHGQKIDAVVMNWNQSGHFSGHDLLLGIRRLARTSDIPVIVLGEDKDTSEAYAHGATHCLPATCGMPLLMERLRNYLRPLPRQE